MVATRRASTHRVGDLIYDTIHIAGIGGGIVALFFLGFDVATGRDVLFTPSLMGQVLLDGAPASAVQSVDMGAVARYTPVHMLAFTLFGFGLAWIVQQAELRSQHPLRLVVAVFAALQVGFWVVMQLAIPGVLERIGLLPIAAANLLASGGIALFLVATHQPGFVAQVLRAARPGSGARE